MPTKKNTTASVLLADSEGGRLPMLDAYTTKGGDLMFALLSKNGANFGKRGVQVRQDTLPTGDTLDVIAVDTAGKPVRTGDTLDVTDITVSKTDDEGNVTTRAYRRATGQVTLDGTEWHVDIRWSASGPGHAAGGVYSGPARTGSTSSGKTRTATREDAVLALLKGGK